MENNEQANKFLIPLAIVVAGVMVAAAIYFGGSAPSRSLTGGDSSPVVEVPDVSDKDHYFGDRAAKVVVIEYSDTECPFCKVFHYTMKDVVAAYGNDVAWVYRHFPIPQLHERAMKEAEATECAAELGGNEAFWSYLDGIFEKTNSNDTLDPAELPRIAAAIGLDVTAFNSCLSSGRHQNKISQDIEDAVKAGARGTPYSIIVSENGDKAVINGAEPLANVRQKIDALLK
jgi:protein-disulfide isomerase